MDHRIARLGALLAALAVALGAFGAHALADRVPPDRLATFETAVRYHFYHALAIVAVAAWLAAPAVDRRGARRAAWLFAGGIAVFSGSLYLLVLTGQGWLGAVTPVGGGLFIVGWLALARAARARTPDG